jgi:hypothetical protein
VSFAGSCIFPDAALIKVAGEVGADGSVGNVVAFAPGINNTPPIRTDNLAEIPFRKLFLSTDCPPLIISIINECLYSYLFD